MMMMMMSVLMCVVWRVVIVIDASHASHLMRLLPHMQLVQFALMLLVRMLVLRVLVLRMRVVQLCVPSFGLQVLLTLCMRLGLLS